MTVATWLQGSHVRVSGLTTQVPKVHEDLDMEGHLQPEPLLKRESLKVQD